MDGLFEYENVWDTLSALFCFQTTSTKRSNVTDLKNSDNQLLTGFQMEFLIVCMTILECQSYA